MSKYPLKLSFQSEIIPVLSIIVSFALSMYFYFHFGDTVTTHWNFQGEPDGYSGKAVGAFGMPALMIGIYILLLVMPLLDPKRDRYHDFEKVYHMFKAGFLFFFFCMVAATGFFNLGYDVPINYIIPFLVGLLLMMIGNFMGKIKNNWFMGIRTPWTLASEDVWNKTHRMGGYSFIFLGLVIMVAPFVQPAIALGLLIAGVVGVVLGTMVYSYILYHQEQTKKEGK